MFIINQLEQISNSARDIIKSKYNLNISIYDDFTEMGIDKNGLLNNIVYLNNLNKNHINDFSFLPKDNLKLIEILTNLSKIGVIFILSNDIEKTREALKTNNQLTVKQNIQNLFYYGRKFGLTIIVQDDDDTEEKLSDISTALENYGASTKYIESIVSNINLTPNINLDDIKTISDMSVYITKNYYK